MLKLVTVIACIAALIALVRMVMARRSLHETTLLAPQFWLVMAVAAVATVEVIAGFIGTNDRTLSLEAWQFFAAAATFCPNMALMGAKRPQHRGWQWIVGSLWLIVALSAAHGVLLQSRGPIMLDATPKVFLVGLIGLGVLNHVATQFWLAAVLIAASQGLLFAEWVMPSAASLEWLRLAGSILFSVGAAMSAFAVPIRSPPADDFQTTFDVAWREFRDRFGTLWGLRVMGRFNADAELCGWPVRLSWQRLTVAHATELTEPQRHAVNQSMRMLLRRFVSSDWLPD